MGFSRKKAIRKGTEIKRVIEKGRCIADDLLRLHLLPTDNSSASRAAFVIPRYGRTAVARNRLKRRLQELIRSFPELSKEYLVVIRVRPACYKTSFRDLEQRLLSLVKRVVNVSS
ncbi:MAG: ribonuclease P protein component [Gemmatimonadota bacterium]|nr:ribonuclease P protein component [Gemmatimonadota bacterium]